ncbi:MAG: MerR family transcriptional regulator [Clostridia bacterium]|nr:MerR family transcriptional regulator [Clostridia bacterium]
MLKIGEFARICRVSTQTLRYYDAEGVLCADRIDPETGYRYYAPEKLETFRLIQTYKDAGFSLDEIKLLLAGDSAERGSLMAVKRQEIERDLKELQSKLSLLESMSRQRERLGERSLEEFYQTAFEDDPDVLGCWELCGRLIAPIDGDPPDPAAPLEPCNIPRETFSRLVMLPHGAPWWMFLWSRGVIYQIYAPYHTLIPNSYTLWEADGTRYMTLRYITGACLHRGEDPIWLLYRQTRHGALTNLESRAFVDQTDMTIIPDPAVIGEWETVAFVRDPALFTLDDIPRSRAGMWIQSATFTARGGCIRRYAQQGRMSEQLYPYTRLEDATPPVRGVILTPSNHLAEEYLLREVEGETYLFVQHKSGDYYYGGQAPHWYVFRRAARQG